VRGLFPFLSSQVETFRELFSTADETVGPLPFKLGIFLHSFARGRLTSHSFL